jgi:hypothetical protein
VELVVTPSALMKFVRPCAELESGGLGRHCLGIRRGLDF